MDAALTTLLVTTSIAVGGSFLSIASVVVVATIRYIRSGETDYSK